MRRCQPPFLSELSAVLALERWWEAGLWTGDRAQPRWLTDATVHYDNSGCDKVMKE